ATAFEMDTIWIIEAAARRQKWIDQAQSLNIYMAGASGKKLDETYKLAWLRGLKTTYYLRTIGATHTEKSTSKIGALNAVSVDAGNAVYMAPSNPISVPTATAPGAVMADEELAGPACMLRPGDAGFEECEACQ
ncbi:MAG: hypothetical protein RL748_586, partial [Pseudomonadota bacterium]